MSDASSTRLPMRAMALCFWIVVAASVARPAIAEDTLPLDELLESFGYSLEGATIRTERIADGLYVIHGIGGNVAVSIGESGVLIVDDQFPEMIPQIEAAIAGLGGKGIDFAINTHWHFDHADGNLVLGPAGTWIVSHENSREMMKRSNRVDLVYAKYRQEAYPRRALPVITYRDEMELYFNGERIGLLHYGSAHTTGDTAVMFRGHNAVHMGDVFDNSGYPFIDVGNGGGIDGMIAFVRAVLDQLEPGAIVIPGHGEVATYAVLKRYVEKLQIVRDRIAALISKGENLEEVLASKPTADLGGTEGDDQWTNVFIDRVYTSLKAKKH